MSIEYVIIHTIKGCINPNYHKRGNEQMNTNSLKFRDEVQNHIIHSLDEDNGTLENQLKTVVSEFKNWYCPYEQKVNSSRQEAFMNWLTCLPSCLSIEHAHYTVSQTMAKWFTNCGMEYKFPKDTDKEFKTYLYLVSREFNRLCKKNKIDSY